MPEWRPHIRPRLAALRLSPTRETEIIEELSQHLQDRWEELVASGASEDDATTLALAGFRDGDLLARHLAPLRQASMPEPIRPEASAGRLSATIGPNLRYAARNLARRPTLVVVAALSLGLGAGFNATLFNLFNALVLRAPTASAPHELVRIEPGNGNLISFPNYRDLPATPVLPDYVAFTTTRMNLGREPQAQRVIAMMASANLFQVLGVEPAMGRPFDAEANAPDRDPRVALLSDHLWRGSFGADADIVGRRIHLNGQAFTVLGVLTPTYRPLTGSFRPDLYVPVSTAIAPEIADRRAPILTLVGRLGSDASPAQGRAAFGELSRMLEAVYPDANKDFSKPAFMAPIAGLASLQSRAAPQGLYAMIAAPFVLVGLVLVVACANIAGLLLARGLSRRREIAIRLALGASRRQVVEMLIAESLLLSIVGVVAGAMLMLWLTSLLGRVRLPGLPETLDVTVVGDGTFALYLMALVLVTTVACALAPAAQALREDLVGALKAGIGGQRVGRRLSLRRALVVTQVAVSALLLVISLMFVRSLWLVAHVDPGFDRDSGVVARIELDPVRYPAAQARLLAEQMMERAARLPGVTAASLANMVPLGGDSNLAYPLADSRPGVNGPETNITNIGPDYFRTMGIPVVRGREFTSSDRSGSLPVVIVNEALADQLFPDGNAIGRRVRLNPDAQDHEVIGIVRNSKYQFLSESPRPLLYFPYLQSGGRLMLLVRATGAPDVMVPVVRAVIAESDSALIADVRTLREVTNQEFVMRRAGAALLAVLGAVGLLLTIIGLYGLMAYAVTERTAEIGLRSALGAQRWSIVWTVMRDGLRLTGIGTSIGFAIAILITHPFAFLLAGISAKDPTVIVAAGVLFFVVSTFACLGPAMRALRVDPLIALRRE